MKKININQLEIGELSNKSKYFSIIESLLFVSGEPLKLKNIAAILECEIQYTAEILNEMQLKYVDEERGIKLIAINDEYQLVTKSQNGDYVQKLLKTNTRQSLSQAALESLAIVAYKQPITRAQIDEIRGVKSDRAILTLQEKNLIKESGRLEAPGRPILYGTTEEFLRCFDLSNLEQLPELESLLNEAEEEASIDSN
ncbi:segregation and condensation protein B [Clostridium acidisoli DSM 12555]|uniref:Segregation and condensation protein B n=1 Tax=Clostridium acidisoli DSM 12555 TaxID=1121291 RepID=A0A1W1X0V8_9CLOT|nr:SMC-Scp complex subunit ScpB [Clostridium acidisoli]SMC17358.1 segregation and condensation protein B [Clostridium acidisoli DSM 12555]